MCAHSGCRRLVVGDRKGRLRWTHKLHMHRMAREPRGQPTRGRLSEPIQMHKWASRGSNLLAISKLLSCGCGNCRRIYHKSIIRFDSYDLQSFIRNTIQRVNLFMATCNKWMEYFFHHSICRLFFVQLFSETEEILFDPIEEMDKLELYFSSRGEAEIAPKEMLN